MKILKISKMYVNVNRGTDNTKGWTMKYKTLNRMQNIEQHESHETCGEPRCSGGIRSSRSTSVTRRVIAIRH